MAGRGAKAVRPDQDRARDDEDRARDSDREPGDRERDAAPIDGREVARMLAPTESARGGDTKRPVQRRASLARALDPASTHAAAATGVEGVGQPLPFAERIQASFGAHDVSDVRAHTGDAARAAATDIGARAYATGSDVAFGDAPDLHTAAHEAAHVVQQRGRVQLKGGVGEAGDVYERHADAVADRVVQGAPAGDLLDQVATRGTAGSRATVQLLQLALADDLRGAIRSAAPDGQHVIDLVAAAPLAEVTAVAGNPSLVRQIEARLPAATRDSLRARLARRLFLDGSQADQAWGLITGDDRARRQRYLDAYGSVAEQRAFCDGVITAGTSTANMIRAFDSYWDVEASREHGLQWSVEFIQRVQANCKLLPEQDVRSGAWKKLTLGAGTGGAMSAGSMSDDDWEGDLTAGAGITYAGQHGRLQRAAAAGATHLFVENPFVFAKDARIAIGGMPSPDVKKIVDVNAALKRYTIDTPLTRGYTASSEIGPAATNGRSTTLTCPVAAAATEVFVADVTPFTVGLRVSFGPYPSPDVKAVSAIDPATQKITLASQLSHGWAAGVELAPMTATAYGTGTVMTAPADAAATEIVVQDVAVFAVGATVAIGPRPSADVKRITAIDAAARKLTLDSGLSKRYEVTVVTPNDATAMRNVDWVGAVMRHEIGHSVDAAIHAGGFYALGGWSPGTSLDVGAWASAMGDAWQTNDHSVISDADQAAIKQHLDTAKGVNAPRALNQGLDPRHAINRYWNKDVPIIEAAKPCIAMGQRFWTKPEDLKKVGSRYFTINTYYGSYQFYNEQVQTQRVRPYQLFSPAEFFAENYTVFYEEVGRVPDGDLGRFVPVGEWRDWIRNKVHNRGHVPSTSASAGLPSPSVGVSAGKGGH